MGRCVWCTGRKWYRWNMNASERPLDGLSCSSDAFLRRLLGLLLQSLHPLGIEVPLPIVDPHMHMPMLFARWMFMLLIVRLMHAHFDVLAYLFCVSLCFACPFITVMLAPGAECRSHLSPDLFTHSSDLFTHPPHSFPELAPILSDGAGGTRLAI